MSDCRERREGRTRFGQLISNQKAVCLQNPLEPIQGFKQRIHIFLVCLLSCRESRLIHPKRQIK